MLDEACEYEENFYHQIFYHHERNASIKRIIQ